MSSLSVISTMTTKFWTVVEGQIGTVHINRKGKQVDFRPTLCISIESDFVFVACPKGQENIPEVKVNLRRGKKPYFGAFFAYTITQVGLSDGSTPFVVIKEVEIVVNDIPVRIKHEGSRLISIPHLITPESLAFHEEWKVKEKAQCTERKAECLAKIEAHKIEAKRFINSLHSLYERMSGTERRWIRRFASNSIKAREEVINLLYSLDKEGMAGFNFTHCMRYELLSSKLKEVLNLN